PDPGTAQVGDVGDVGRGVALRAAHDLVVDVVAPAAPDHHPDPGRGRRLGGPLLEHDVLGGPLPVGRDPDRLTEVVVGAGRQAALDALGVVPGAVVADEDLPHPHG